MDLKKHSNKIKTKRCLKKKIAGVDPKAITKGIIEKYILVEKYQLKK